MSEKLKYVMAHHNVDGNSITGLAVTLSAWIFTRIPMVSEMAGFVTIVVGLSTLLINYPKIVARIKEIKNNFKRKT